MHHEIRVHLGEHTYPIWLGSGLLPSSLEPFFQEFSEIALITDTTIQTLPWYEEIETFIQQRASKYTSYAIPSGESSKNIETFRQICSHLASGRFSRKTLLIALGGGVVGDIAGFVAATFLRGISYIQIPTTLLACVDSSVGGKTALNLPEGKNLIGAFYQPQQVLIDTSTLRTLPQRHCNAGMAEVIKYAAIMDESLWLRLLWESSISLEDIILHSITHKASIVREDEKEVSGKRALLNFGHTVGHAIEQLTDYKQYFHGEAVSMGMVVACVLSEKMLNFSPSSTSQLKEILSRYDLPTVFPGDVDHRQILESVSRDKKSTGQRVNWVLLDQVGKAQLNPDVTDELLLEVLRLCSPSSK